MNPWLAFVLGFVAGQLVLTALVYFFRGVIAEMADGDER